MKKLTKKIQKSSKVTTDTWGINFTDFADFIFYHEGTKSFRSAWYTKQALVGKRACNQISFFNLKAARIPVTKPTIKTKRQTTVSLVPINSGLVRVVIK